MRKLIIVSAFGIFFFGQGLAVGSDKIKDTVWVDERSYQEDDSKKKDLRIKASENPRNKAFSESFQNVGGYHQEKQEERKKEKTGN
jgi:hypothetical protein